MNKFFACLSLVAASMAPFLFVHSAAGQVVIDTTFGDGRPIQTSAPDRITGTLPAPWRDNSEWAQVWVDYRSGDDQARPFTRITTTRVEDGHTQLQCALPAIMGETYVRLELTARSADEKMVQIGLRDLGVPYAFHWETTARLGTDWKSLRYDFRQGKIDRPIGFYLLLDGAGKIDLATVKLTYFSRDELMAEMKRQAHDAGSQNLLRLSRFPLGMQMGWSLNRDLSDGDEVVIDSDRDCIGPSTFPALHVRSEQRVDFYTTPFGIPNAFEKHIARVQLTGQGQVTVRVMCDGQALARQQVALTESWQKVELSFDPRLLAGCYALRIESRRSCDFHLDAMQVVSATTAASSANDFAGQLPYEVALQVPASDASAARIQFLDEPAALEYCVTSTTPAAGASLRATVFNAYGESQALAPVPIEGRIVFGRLADFLSGLGRQIGPHRVEVWVEDGAGKRISTFNEMLVHRLPRPKYWGLDAPQSAFGVHTTSTTRHCLMLKAIGANWTRLHDAGLDYIGWYHLEPEQGRWQFRDDPIHRYRKHHVLILGELGTAPPWASYHPGYDVNGYFDRFYQPRNIEDYARYVRTVAERYKGVIHAWDVWNEPWITSWWGVGYDKNQGSGAEGYVRSPTAQKDFARLMKTAYSTVKAVDPSAVVLGINTTTGGGGSSFSGDAWTRGVVDAGGLADLDAIAYHQYTGELNLHPNDDVERGFATATGYVSEQCGGKLNVPVWMTEGQNARMLAHADMIQHALPNPPTDSDPFLAGDRQVRFLAALRARGVAKMFLYSMHSHDYFDNGGEWRAITSGDGYLHPQGVAIAVLAQQIEDHRFISCVQAAEGVWAYLFQADDNSRAVALLAPEESHAEYGLPAGALDLFGNPLPEGAPLGRTVCYVPLPAGATGMPGR